MSSLKTSSFYLDITQGIKFTRPSPAFLYCKEQKAGQCLRTVLCAKYLLTHTEDPCTSCMNIVSTQTARAYITYIVNTM